MELQIFVDFFSLGEISRTQRGFVNTFGFLVYQNQEGFCEQYYGKSCDTIIEINEVFC